MPITAEIGRFELCFLALEAILDVQNNTDPLLSHSSNFLTPLPNFFEIIKN